MDRLLIIETACAVGIACSAFMWFYGHYYILVFALGGIIASLYSVAITFLNDQIKKSQVIAASRSLILFNAIGATIGPLVGGAGLTFFGANSLFGLCLLFMGSMMIVARYRSIVGKTIKPKHDFVQVPAYAAPSVMRLQSDVPVATELPPEENKEDKSA